MFITGEFNPFGDNAIAEQNSFASGREVFNLNFLRHLDRSVRTGEVTYMDYGPQENMERYGQEDPPRVRIEDTANDVALLASNEDQGATRVDNDWYADQLGDNLVSYNYYDFSHMAFILGDTQQYLPDLDDLYQSYLQPQDG